MTDEIRTSPAEPHTDGMHEATNGAFPVSALNRVRQMRERAHYDRETVFAILDRGLVAHVAFVHDGRPVVIPMTYGRDGERIFLHGARKGRVTSAPAGEPVSIGVTLVDGLVVGSSMFDASMNYRAVVIHGHAREVEDRDERVAALRCISEHVLPGRWDEVREPLDKELKATAVLEVTIEAASAKIRQASAAHLDEPLDEGVWIGVVPVVTALGQPVPDAMVPRELPVPPSVRRLLASR